MTDKTSNERLLVLARFLRGQIALADRPPAGHVQINNEEATRCAEALEKVASETGEKLDDRIREGRLSGDPAVVGGPVDRVVVGEPLASAGYVTSGPHLSGYRVSLGFDTLEKASAAHQRIVDLQKGAGETTVSPSPIAQAILDRVTEVNVGLFLAGAIDHIEKGGNLASGQVELRDGTLVELSMLRLPVKAPGESHGS